jgi:hypothetical protein
VSRSGRWIVSAAALCNLINCIGLHGEMIPRPR